MSIEVSIAVIAIAFVVLVIFLSVALNAMRITLNQLSQTLAETKRELHEIGNKAQKVAEHTNQISFDLKQKLEALNPIFNAVNNAGEVLEGKTSDFKKEFKSARDEDFEFYDSEKKKSMYKPGIRAAAAVLELAGIGIRLWQKLKR